MKISRQLSNDDVCSLFGEALIASTHAYAPYSHFRVGAAILFEDGKIVTGVNVENRSFGLTNCAERAAIYTAIGMGKKTFKAIAIATPDSDYPVPPCGACRQVISEFSTKDTPVFFGSCKENIQESTIGELYPIDSLHDLR